MDELRSSLPQGFTFSQSSLQDYTDCPRRFQLRYIEKLAWPAVETEPVLENERHQQEGQLFHRLVQQHLLGLPIERLARLASTPNLSRWWENYLSSDLGINGYAQYPELTLTLPVDTYRLVAKYDLIAVNPEKTSPEEEKILIFDWKTYHKRPRNEWMVSRLQTPVYRAMLIQTGAHLNAGTPIQPEYLEMVYWYADFPSEPARLPYSSTQYRRDWEKLVKLINEISHHRHFPMTGDEKKCVFCPYRSYCNRGVEAGTEDEGIETELTDNEINLEQIAEIEF